MDLNTRNIYAVKAFCGIYPKLWDLMKDRNIDNWKTEGSIVSQADAIKFIKKITDEEIMSCLN